MNEPISKVCSACQCDVVKEGYSNSQYHKSSCKRKCNGCVSSLPEDAGKAAQKDASVSLAVDENPQNFSSIPLPVDLKHPSEVKVSLSIFGDSLLGDSQSNSNIESFQLYVKDFLSQFDNDCRRFDKGLSKTARVGVESFRNYLKMMDPLSIVTLRRSSLATRVDEVPQRIALPMVSLLEESLELGNFVVNCAMRSCPGEWMTKDMVFLNASTVEDGCRSKWTPSVSKDNETHITAFQINDKSSIDALKLTAHSVCRVISHCLEYLRANVWSVSSRFLVLFSSKDYPCRFNSPFTRDGKAVTEQWLENINNCFADLKWHERISLDGLVESSGSSVFYVISYDRGFHVQAAKQVGQCLRALKYNYSRVLDHVCALSVNDGLDLQYSALQMSIFGHSGEINGDEWHAKCQNLHVDVMQLHQLSSLRLQLLENHYRSKVEKLPEVQCHQGEWLYLVDFSLSNFSFFTSNEEAFDAGCDRCVIPPVVYTIQIGACDERSKRSGVLVSDNFDVADDNDLSQTLTDMNYYKVNLVFKGLNVILKRLNFP